MPLNLHSCEWMYFCSEKNNSVLNSSFHIGQVIRAELRRQGHTNRWLAEQINVNPRTINKIFLKNVIDTQQLLVISKAMDYDFFKLYSNLV